jgi:oligopeptidase B
MSFSLNVEIGSLTLLSRTLASSGGRDIRDTHIISSELAKSHDGELIPVTIVHERNRSDSGARNRPSPLLLLAYGAYGKNCPIHFCLTNMALLKLGWRIAFAHVRGGSENGRSWYDAGRKLNKWNSFHDFAAVATKLIEDGYTSPSMLCGKANSAGGLILGVMANEHPDLFAGFVMRNPFLDVESIIQQPDLPLTVHEYDEWGDGRREEVIEYIQSYSPCSNIRKQAYPAVLIQSGLQDTKVDPLSQSLRWIQLIKKHQMDSSRPCILRLEDGGHDGSPSVYDELRAQACEVFFLEKVISKEGWV